jgi:hypothetical protein
MRRPKSNQYNRGADLPRFIEGKDLVANAVEKA